MINFFPPMKYVQYAHIGKIPYITIPEKARNFALFHNNDDLLVKIYYSLKT
ncbi:hypothetical protein LGAA44_150050 [Leuconostoc gasicomitatum]|nr:hypothetical protein LGAA44_150050 [Leuconostoc gasicomitatum]